MWLDQPAERRLVALAGSRQQVGHGACGLGRHGGHVRVCVALEGASGFAGRTESTSVLRCAASWRSLPWREYGFVSWPKLRLEMLRRSGVRLFPDSPASDSRPESVSTS